MRMAEEHAQKLRAARAQMVRDRRDIADALAREYQPGHTERMRETFVSLQQTIEAIDRAIADETESSSTSPGPVIKVGRR